ncbi:Sensor histidine kinase YehU [compost metagenome]
MVMTQKLIVQPIVENALYHAIEQMEEPGVITISAQATGKDIIIIVKDNGPGFDLSTLMSLWDKEHSSNTKKYSDNGVGLRNVHERLNIRFGNPYGILVCSSPGFGSTICIRIPKIQR